MHKFWNIASNYADDSVLNMYVYGDIVTDSNFWFGSPDDVVTREFIKDLNRHPNASRINVYINSGGGEVFAAVAIAQQLKKHKAEVHTYVEGIAASAATIIAMAGDVRHMTTSGLYMIHLPSSSARGNKHDLAKSIEVLEKVEAAIRLTYSEKTNLSDAELTDMLDHETWLTAEEAYRYGFITDIETNPDDIDNLIKEVQDDLFSMNGIDIKISAYADPEQLRKKLAEIQNNKIIIGGNVMKLQDILNSLPADKRSVFENAVKAEIDNKTTELNTQVTNLTTQMADLTDQLAASQQTLTETQDKLTAAEDKVKQLESQASAEDADTAFLNSLPAEARQAVLDARQVAAAATEALNKANEEKAFDAFKDKVKAYDNLPLNDEHVSALYNLSKACPEDFTTIEALFNSADVAMNAQFSQVGQDGTATEAPKNAYEEIENLIKDRRAENPEMDYNEAFKSVITENPDLYDRYRSGL